MVTLNTAEPVVPAGVPASKVAPAQNCSTTTRSADWSA